MPLSERSEGNLLQCHEDLKTLFREVALAYDCEVIQGHRGQKDQDKAVLNGNSRTPWPKSPHNKQPSMAADVCPLPIDWKNKEAFYFFGGWVLATAQRLKREGKMTHEVRWGGDWNSNKNLKDQQFYDLPHFELIEA